MPTYEAKDLGLAVLKQQDYNYQKSIIITGNEQQQYLAVVIKALEQFKPELARATEHLTHGIVKLKGGAKMSSREGNILRAEAVLDAAEESARKLSGEVDNRVVLAAVKYSMLKTRTGGDIIFDPEESLSVLGNSGPYLQYAHARARSILSKADELTEVNSPGELTPEERTLLLSLSRFNAVTLKAARELAPHDICTYLYELAQVFNRFYEVSRVIGDERQDFRLMLVANYAEKLRQGLGLLGIEAPDKL